MKGQRWPEGTMANMSIFQEYSYPWYAGTSNGASAKEKQWEVRQQRSPEWLAARAKELDSFPSWQMKGWYGGRLFGEELIGIWVLLPPMAENHFEGGLVYCPPMSEGYACRIPLEQFEKSYRWMLRNLVAHDGSAGLNFPLDRAKDEFLSMCQYGKTIELEITTSSIVAETETDEIQRFLRWMGA